jgi:hypothetical protein
MSLPSFAYEGVGYRGLKLDGNKELERKYLDHKNEFSVGNLMTFPAFMSVSTDDSVADDFGDYVFFVFVKVRGAKIARLSQVPKEVEILVPPPSVFRIKAVAKFGGRLTITLEQEDSPLTYVSQTASDSAVASADAAPAGLQPKPEIMAAVESMGFSNGAARKAALAVSNSSADAAVMWVMEHMDDPTLNDAPVASEGCIKIPEAVSIQFAASSVTSARESPSAANIMKCFEGQFCNCCVSDYNPCTADLEHDICDFDWFMQPFCAFFGLRIPWACIDRDRSEPCSCFCLFCAPCFGTLKLSAALYFLLGLIMLPWYLCFFLAGVIRVCEKTCCGGPSTLFKCVYFPPLFLALSFHWMWKRMCCSRTCFGLCRGACGPGCNVLHKTPCIVCGKKHDVTKIDGEIQNNHTCEDGRRGSFAWNFEEGDPVCPCPYTTDEL